MEHFKGIVPEERWKNELLAEMKAIRTLLEKVIDRDAQTVNTEVKPVSEKRKYTRRGVG